MSKEEIKTKVKRLKEVTIEELYLMYGAIVAPKHQKGFSIKDVKESEELYNIITDGQKYVGAPAYYEFAPVEELVFEIQHYDSLLKDLDQPVFKSYESARAAEKLKIRLKNIETEELDGDVNSVKIPSGSLKRKTFKLPSSS